MGLVQLPTVDHHRGPLPERDDFAVDEEQPGAAVAIAQLKGVVIVKGLDGIGKQSLSADKFVHWFCSVEMKEVGLYAKGRG